VFGDGAGCAVERVGDVGVGRLPRGLVVAEFERRPERLALALGERVVQPRVRRMVLPEDCLADGESYWMKGQVKWGDTTESEPGDSGALCYGIDYNTDPHQGAAASLLSYAQIRGVTDADNFVGGTGIYHIGNNHGWYVTPQGQKHLHLLNNISVKGQILTFFNTKMKQPDLGGGDKSDEADQKGAVARFVTVLFIGIIMLFIIISGSGCAGIEAANPVYCQPLLKYMPTGVFLIAALFGIIPLVRKEVES